MRVESFRLHNISPPFYGESKLEDLPGVVVLLGPNGSGKTTILKSLARLLYASISSKEDTRYSKASLEALVNIHGRRYKLKYAPKDVFSAIDLGAGKTLSAAQRQKSVLGLMPQGKKKGEKRDPIKELYKLTYFSLNEFEKKIELKDFILDVTGLTKLSMVLDKTRELLKIEKGSLNSKLEHYKRKKDEIDKTIKELKRKIEEYSKEIKKLGAEIEELEGRISELKARKNKLSKFIATAEGEMKSLKEQLDEIPKLEEVELAIFEELGSSVRLLKRFQEAGGSKTIETMNRLLAKAKALGLSGSPEELVAMLDELRRKRDDQYNELNKVTKALGELKGEIESLKRNIEELRREALKIGRELESFKSSISSLGCSLDNALECLKKRLEEREELLRDREAKLAETRSLIENEKKILEILKNSKERGEPRCPMCGSELSEEKFEELLKEHEAKLEELRMKKKELKEEIESLKKQYERVSSLFEKATVMIENRKRSRELLLKAREMEREAEEKERELKKLEEKEKSLNEEIKTLDEKIKIIERINELLPNRKQAQKAFEQLSEEVIRKYEKMRIKHSEEEIDEILSKLETIRKANKLKARLAELEEQLKKARKELEEVEKELHEAEEMRELKMKERSKLEGELKASKERIEELKAELPELREKIEKLEKAINTLGVIINRLTARGKGGKLQVIETALDVIISKVNKKLKELNEILMNYGSGIVRYDIRLERGRGTQLTLKARRVDDPTGTERDLSKLSGGETALATVMFLIAFRLAMLGTLGAQIPLMLDEPTANTDKEVRMEIVKLLETFVKQGVIPQVFIATHDSEFVDELAERLNVKIFVLEKKGFSTEVKPLAELSSQRRAALLFATLLLSHA